MAQYNQYIKVVPEVQTFMYMCHLYAAKSCPTATIKLLDGLNFCTYSLQDRDGNSKSWIRRIKNLKRTSELMVEIIPDIEISVFRFIKHQIDSNGRKN